MKALRSPGQITSPISSMPAWSTSSSRIMRADLVWPSRSTSVCSGRLRWLRRMEKQRQRDGGSDGRDHRHEEQAVEVRRPVVREHLLDQIRADGVGQQRAEAEDHHVEQSLRAGAGVLRKIRVHENVNRCEEERIADAVENL